MCTKPATRRRPMTLLEVAIACMILGLLSIAVLNGILTASASAHISAQYAAAFGLCDEKMEEIRAISYEDVVGDNFPPEEDLVLTHTEASPQVDIFCEREVTIEDSDDLAELANPVGKRITVRVTWEFGGREHVQSLQTMIFAGL